MKEFRNPEDIHQPLGAYPHQVEVKGNERLLVLSGQVGMRQDGTVPGGEEIDARDEHGLAELERTHPERTEPPTERRQARHEVGRVLRQVHPHQGFARLLIGVLEAAVDIEHHDALAEAVEQGLGERREHGRERSERKRVRHDRKDTGLGILEFQRWTSGPGLSRPRNRYCRKKINRPLPS